MSEPLQEYRQQASYRRGAVMGLTAAEAFMLIAFVLLTLLVFWRVTAEKEKKRLIEENAMLTAANGDPAALKRALAFQEKFDFLDTSEVEERLSLMEREKLRSLASAAQNLPDEGLLELTDLTRTRAVPGVIEKLELFNEVEMQPAEIAKRVSDYKDLEKKFARLKEEKAKLEKSTKELNTKLQEIGEGRKRLARTGAEIAATIREKAGDRIAKLGGKILPDGDVIFPEAILFKTGDDRILPQFDALLASFCRLWFQTLYEQRDALDTVQVEGHASSEYGSYGPKEAFVQNLDLSQRRAAAVFSRCLEYGGDDMVTDWARSAMAAVGYSSSRKIMEDGKENRSASRRVVFALEPKTELQMAQ